VPLIWVEDEDDKDPYKESFKEPVSDSNATSE
jgi:hypothetical protein